MFAHASSAVMCYSVLVRPMKRINCDWTSEASRTLGCSIEISHDIYVSVCMSWYAKVRRRNYVAQKRACSVLGG